MKKSILTLIAAAALAQAAWADTPVTISADVLSAYVSRGYVFNDEPVFQPDICFDIPYGFAFDLWATMDLTDNEKSCAPDTAWRWSEFDFQLGWGTDVLEDSALPLSFYVASTYYTYPQFEEDDDYDVSVSLSAKCLLNPKIRFVHECDRDDNYRLDFFLSYEKELADNLTLGIGGECTFGFDGWMEKWNREDDDGNVLLKAGDAGFVDVMVKASLTYAVTENWSIGVNGNYSALIDGDARDAADIDDVDTDIFYCGLSTSWTF